MMIYDKCNGFVSKLDPRRMFATVTDAQNFDIEEAKQRIVACSFGNLTDAVDGKLVQADLRAAIMFLAGCVK